MTFSRYSSKLTKVSFNVSFFKLQLILLYVRNIHCIVHQNGRGSRNDYHRNVKGKKRKGPRVNQWLFQQRIARRQFYGLNPFEKIWFFCSFVSFFPFNLLCSSFVSGLLNLRALALSREVSLHGNSISFIVSLIGHQVVKVFWLIVFPSMDICV